MAQELEDLPLFPLNTVVFPHSKIKLNVFEARYREMVELCLREARPFGIVLIREGSETGPADPYMVGTACHITEVRTFDDGTMEIGVVGERRFRIREIDDSRPYLVGRVEPVLEHDIVDDEHAAEVFARARDEFEALIRQALERESFSVRVVFPPDPVVLSFTIANLLQIENLRKQRLLETTDTVERMEDLIPILERQIMEGGLLPERETNTYRLTADDLSDWVFHN